MMAATELYDKKPVPQAAEPVIFEGKVAVSFTIAADSKLKDAPATHHHIFKAEAVLKECWPGVYQQFGETMKGFHPKYMPDTEDDGFLGSMSHQQPGYCGSMWATVNDYFCLSQAFVFGLAHNNLFAMGQQVADLFTNDAAELYDSAMWLDNPRPIAAIFHDLYAFIHVLTLDRRILEHAALDERERAYVISLLNKNASRVRIGMDMIAKCARLTPSGENLVNDTLTWAAEEMHLSQKYIAKIKQGQQVLIIGPSGAGKSTFSKALSKKTGMEAVFFDTICWSYWYQLPVLQDWLLKTVGEEQLVLWNETLVAKQKQIVVRTIVENKVITHEAKDWLKYQLIVYAINNFKGHILDTGGGHVVFHNEKYVRLLKQLLVQNNIKVIQIKPLAHVEQVKEIVSERMKTRTYTPGELEKAKNNVFSPAYRTLSDYVIDSNKPVDECIATFFELSEPIPVQDTMVPCP
ncbi:MAG: HEXXH motif-containing putative peptide modification protein [Bacteroidota bacterium]